MDNQDKQISGAQPGQQPVSPAVPVNPPINNVNPTVPPQPTQPQTLPSPTPTNAANPLPPTPANTNLSQPTSPVVPVVPVNPAVHPSSTGVFVSTVDDTQVDPSKVINFNENKGRFGFTKAKHFKAIFISLLVVLVIVGGGLGFYFGYWLNPSVIWSNSLSDTGKGETKLVSYLNNQSNVTYKGYQSTASLMVKDSGTTYSGSFNEENNGINSQSSLKLNLGPAKLNLQVVTLKQPTADSPDIYFNLSGFKALSLGQYLGVNEQALDSLDGQWISVDHTLIDQVKKAALPQDTNAPKLTQKDIISTAQTLAAVNSQYVFTTNKSKSVTYVVKRYGFETVGGYKTYHYKVGFVKANVKSYITAIRNALQTTPVGKYATKVSGESINDVIGYSALEASANNINSSDTIDVWSGVNTRIIYKVRVSDSSNPSTNYVEVGLNYKNMQSFPFFVNFHNKNGASTSNTTLLLTFNTVTNEIDGSLTIADPGDQISATADASVQPNNQTYKITAPANAITLQQAMAKLGLSAEYNQILQSIASSGSSSSSVPGSGISPSLSIFNSLSSI